MSDRTRVHNAGDRQQIRKAEKEIKRERDLALSDLRTVLARAEGRRTIWRWISRLRPLERMWEPSALMQFKAGQHDAAVMIINEIDEADPNAMLLMMQEARQQEPPKLEEKTDDFADTANDMD